MLSGGHINDVTRSQLNYTPIFAFVSELQEII